jgi:hypothetical protein
MTVRLGDEPEREELAPAFWIGRSKPQAFFAMYWLVKQRTPMGPGTRCACPGLRSTLLSPIHTFSPGEDTTRRTFTRSLRTSSPVPQHVFRLVLIRLEDRTLLSTLSIGEQRTIHSPRG